MSMKKCRQTKRPLVNLLGIHVTLHNWRLLLPFSKGCQWIGNINVNALIQLVTCMSKHEKIEHMATLGKMLYFNPMTPAKFTPLLSRQQIPLWISRLPRRKPYENCCLQVLRLYKLSMGSQATVGCSSRLEGGSWQNIGGQCRKGVGACKARRCENVDVHASSANICFWRKRLHKHMLLHSIPTLALFSTPHQRYIHREVCSTNW